MSTRVPGFDGIRGVAIVLVLVAHLVGLNGAGLVGVLLFFVLSGYLITSLLLAEADREGHVDLPRFYLRRALRLIPALVLLLVLVGVLSMVPGTGITPPEAVRGALQGLFYVTDFTVGLQLDYVPQLAHLWTLAVEEQFYLLWPIVLLLVMRRAAPEKPLRAVSWMLGVGVVLRILTVLLAEPLDLFFYALPTTWVDTLLVGCAVAIAVHHDPAPTGRTWGLVMSPAVGLVAWLVLLGLSWTPATFTSPLTYVIGLPVLAASAVRLVLASDGDGRTARILRNPVLRWFGDHSYGLYLFNSTSVLVLTSLLGPGLTTRAIGITVAVAVAVLSRRFLEQPALDLKDRLDRRRPGVAP